LHDRTPAPRFANAPIPMAEDERPSMSRDLPNYYGWDLGGAHVKLAVADADGRVLAVAQRPCPLWQGLCHLEEVLRAMRARHVGRPGTHTLTMTGELADLFPDRASGVAAILDCVEAQIADVRVYAGSAGFIDGRRARIEPGRVSSANWLASATWVSRFEPDALFVDVGSTTTDLVAIVAHRVAFEGYSDADRLRSGELDYRGVVRTPVAALVEALPWAGQWRPVMKELFATAGDAAVLAGALVPDERFGPGADGRGWTEIDCARRLARMLGEDLGDAALEPWRELARYVVGTVEDQLRRAVARRLSAFPGAGQPALVGAGVGRYHVESLARRLRRPYREFGSFVAGGSAIPAIGDCAPAVALTQLARSLPA
jgi:probable H4MPT-linked C1 transfer pathway protein